MTATELLADGDFTNADSVKQVTVVTTAGGHPSRAWFLSPGPNSGQPPAAVSLRGYLRLQATQGTRLRQALATPKHDVVLRALVRVMSGELLIGAVDGNRPDPNVEVHADGEWHHIDMAVTGPVDQVVLYAATDATVIDVKQISLVQATPGKTARAAPAECAPAAKQPDASARTTMQATEVAAIGGPAARPAALPGGPITVPEPSITIETLSCPGGNGAEPGAEFTVSGTLATTVLVSHPSVTVTCDGLVFPAAVAADGSSFTVQVRAYRSGSLSVKAVATALSADRKPLSDLWSATMPVTLTNATPTVQFTSVPGSVNLSDTQPTPVPVTVTTADQTQFGPHQVSAGVDIPVALTQVSSTEFTGVVQVPQAPFAAKTITATVGCVETATPPAVAVAVPAGTATATVGVKDNTPPSLVVTFPHGNVVTPVSNLTDPAATITVTGTATDDQTGVAGVAWAWDPAATAPTSATLGAVTALPGGTGEQVAWTAVIPLGESPVQVAGGSLVVPVYFWATDKAGNRAGPQLVELSLARVYRPGDLDGRLAQWEYLNDLLSFAGVADGGQVATPAGKGPVAADIAGVLAQPVDRIAEPPTEAASALATAPINELRVPIEVLRSHIAQQHIPGPAEKTAYLQAAYEGLLAGLGTSYAQLRLARAAADADRSALARRLGIVLAGPAPDTARPDQLDALVVDGPNLTEAALEQLFGLASTQNPDPLAPPAITPQLPAWQRAGARATWQAEDLHPPVPVAYQALIDPDIVSPDEVTGTAPALAGMVTARLTDLTAQDSALLTAVSVAAAQAEAKAGDLMSAFSTTAAKIINTAAAAAAAAGVAPAGGTADPAGTDLITVLGGLQELQQQGQVLTGALAALGLDQPGFSYLLQLQQLAGAATASDAAGFITDQEWADARDVVVAAYRRLKQPIWRQEEVIANCLLGPDAFQINGSGPDLGTYRAETTARQDWQRVLAGRIAQDAALSAATGSLLAATESATLPILRDALLDDITTASGGGAPAYAGTPSANWIWNTTGASSGTPVGTIYLRKTFTVADPSSISSAVLCVNADDGHGTYVNGTLVSSAPGNVVNGWQASQVRDIRSLLVPGTNVIAIAGIADTATPSSVIAVAQLDTTRIVTDGTWKAFPGMPASPPSGWNTIGFDDSSWPVAIVQGPYGISPWDTSIQTPSRPDGDLLTRRYEVDMLASGALTTTRVEVAATSVQLLLADVRAGEVTGDVEPVSPAAAWVVPNTAAFDIGWQVMGSYGAWSSAVTTYLFPESALNPLSWTSPSAPFQDLLTAVQNGGVLDPDTLDPNPPPNTAGIAAYQKAVGALPGGPSFSYEPFTDANQDVLAEVCLDIARTIPSGPDLALLREVFWVVPMLIGGLLTDQGHYADALQWYRLVFRYTNPVDPPYAPSICTQVNQDYKLSVAASPPQLPAPQLGANIWAVNLDPFARTTDPDAPRPVPYLRATLLAIISCLRQYADAQFTAGTDESLARAREMYLDARDLTNHPAFTVIQPITPAEPALPIPQLVALQTTVQSQLAKLRQGRNIAGQPRVPVSVDTTTITAATNYTYKTLLARAQQLTTQAQQLEAQLLNALSNLDAKTLQNDQAQQALDLANAQATAHQDQVTTANDAVTTAQGQLASAQSVVTSLQTAISNPINSYERRLLQDYQATATVQDAVTGYNAAIAIAQSVQNLNAANIIASGGADAAAAATSIATNLIKSSTEITLNTLKAQTDADQLQGSIEDRVQQWQLQLVSAQGSVTAAQNQLSSATDQVTTAQDDLTVARLQQAQAGATLQTLQGQVTSPAMYSWLVQVLGGVYRYFLQQATAVAQLAQAQLAFDRAEPPQTFIRADYWQPPAILVTAATPANTYGLTGAEQLSEDLSTLDGYAFSSDQRSLNISQTFSLSQVMPQEFLDFRTTGQLTFQTPMSWFDADFPGQYLRLIRQVSLTIIALVPPSRGIRATLASNGISMVATVGPYGFSDVTLQREPGLIAVTATSAATGVFTADLQPEMLLPFEGNGVATTWSLTLPPAANPFDFSSITDVMLTIDYTALADDGYRDLVVRSLNANRARSGDCLFSFATGYPDQWYQLTNPDPGADPAQPRTVTITLRDGDFPVNVSGLTTQAITMQLVTAGPDPLPPVTITLGHASQSRIATTDGTGLAGTRRGAADWANITASPAGDWQITLDTAGGALIDAGTITDVLLDITWSGQAPFWQ